MCNIFPRIKITAYPLRASVVINKDSSLCLPAAGRFGMTIKNLLYGLGERLASPASLPTASTDQSLSFRMK